MEEKYILELKVDRNYVSYRINEVQAKDKQNYWYLLDMNTIHNFLSILEHTPVNHLPEYWRENDGKWFKIRRIEIY